MGYEYTDDSGDVVLITGHGDCAHISLGASTCCLISDQRQAAAQELAGDDYRVVPAAEAAAPDGALSLIADVIGTDDLGDVLCAVEGLKEREKEAHHLKRENNDLRKKLADAEVQAAQPDRPEPVDPAKSDPEIAALHQIVTAMNALSSEEQARAVRYLSARYGDADSFIEQLTGHRGVQDA